jgi:hypothetical protein
MVDEAARMFERDWLEWLIGEVTWRWRLSIVTRSPRH